MLDDGTAPRDFPQCPPPGQVGDDVTFGVAQSEGGGGAVELVRRLAEDDLCGRVGEEAGGDLGGGGPVVGLGGEVGGAVGDADIGDAVGAAELETSLQVP